ncbi:MAG: hypothetical protein FJ405_17710 [Verrucomicrobia bacterium]|nr:hypothetical protein [Verrucomicrobiota bacterium]
MILKRPERHTVLLSTKKKDDGTAAQPLFTCALDDSLWLSEAEAVKHGLDHYFDTFYKTEKVPVDPPKGVYTFVAQCGMSGVVLGPPNHHDYQNQLRRLHAERFSRTPFDAFKSRVKIVREETVVKKWVEDQSSKAEYHCLNVDEPLKLDSREEVEKHFREVHVPNLIRQVDTVKVSFEATKKLRHPGLLRTVRMAYEGQRRFPLQVATHLSQQFASRGLQFFKVNKTVTHVAVARPSYLDLETNVVSDGVKKIVEFINSNAKCTRRQLFEALMPSALQLTVNPATPPGTASADSATPESPSPETAPAAKPQITPEIQTFMTDLHWLIHQGHVLEFANGVMETAKKPMPRPTKAPAEKPAGKSEPKAEANVEAAADQVPSEASLAAEASPAPQDAGEQPLGAS